MWRCFNGMPLGCLPQAVGWAADVVGVKIVFRPLVRLCSASRHKACLVPTPIMRLEGAMVTRVPNLMEGPRAAVTATGSGGVLCLLTPAVGGVHEPYMSSRSAKADRSMGLESLIFHSLVR